MDAERIFRMAEGCSNCGRPRHGRSKRCGACRVYLWRNGVERPEQVMIRATMRRIVKELERNARSA